MKFKLHPRSIVIYATLILLIVVGLAIISKSIAKYFDKIIVQSLKPLVSLQQTDPLSLEILFNNQLGTTVFADAIIPLIDQAQTSLEIAMYGFNYPAIKEAIYRAHQRGVKVVLILDKNQKINNDNFLFDLPYGIKRLDLGQTSQQRNRLMHHKFALIDRGQIGEKLIFGSFNWTSLQEKYDPSFLLISPESALIASFGREFDRLSLGWSNTDKLAIRNYQPWDLEIQAGLYNYEVWFSPGLPGNNLNQRLFDLITEAKSDIKIMIWDFTDLGLAQALISQAQAGLSVVILTDTWHWDNERSVFSYLRTAKDKLGLDNLILLSDQAREAETALISSTADLLEKEIDSFFHYHVLMVDEQKILFGTNNWSRNAAYFNDEVAIVSDDPAIIQSFLQSFWENYQINLGQE